MADIIVDLIILAILLVGFIWGIKVGFLKTVAKPVKFLMSLFLAVSFSSVVGTYILKPMIADPIVTKLTVFFTEKIGEGAAVADELPTLVKFAAALAGVDLNAITSAEAQADMVNAIITAVTDPILNLVTSVLGFIILFFIFKILLTIVFAIVDAVINNGVVGAVNKVLGCIVMTFLAVTVVWGLCCISDLILSIPFIHEQEWVQGFNGGWLYNFFKSLSPIDILLSLLLSF